MTFALAVVASKGITLFGVLGVLLLLAIFRMNRYGRHYATELFAQFLTARAKS